jgi:hypothetical protein
MGKPQQKYDPSQEEELRRANYQGQELQGQGQSRVQVDVDLELHAASLSSPVIDLHGVGANDAPMVPEVVSQAVNGEGNTFHHDQFDSIIGDTGIDGASAGVVSDADAALTKSAFAQTITMGANIQFNSATINASGHDLNDGHHTP